MRCIHCLHLPFNGTQGCHDQKLGANQAMAPNHITSACYSENIIFTFIHNYRKPNMVTRVADSHTHKRAIWHILSPSHPLKIRIHWRCVEWSPLTPVSIERQRCYHSCSRLCHHFCLSVRQMHSSPRCQKNEAIILIPWYKYSASEQKEKKRCRTEMLRRWHRRKEQKAGEKRRMNRK